ncbi:anthranilate synthase component I [Oceanobacillus luteolus]|uniref:Anthranilate synthase component 1 n=1 Tax=Oceanobacillus luteolus TaxID=1274358 RepID=A0ABW4HVF7_9BACI|nr:anthranilate synthase component I [Oceanobacillus luteolus]MCM3741184.1 anthranilate synthase component I [Oceanobacillus luteolus]
MTSTALTYQYVKLDAEGKTPIHVFENLSGTKKFLLESTFSHEKKGKFSFLGMNPYQEVIGQSGETTIHHLEKGETEKKDIHVLHYLKKHLPKMETHLPVPFFGGAVGYVGYDAIRDFEDIGGPLPDELQLPEIHFMLFKDIIVFDHAKEAIYLIAVNPNGAPDSNLDNRVQELKEVVTTESSLSVGMEHAEFLPQEAEESFKEKVAKAKEYIEKGEVLQVVLSQRLTAQIKNKPDFPFSFYKSLRESNPSPYMFYVDFQDYKLLGASPESLLQVVDREVTTNPIAGTRPRGNRVEEDLKLEAELLADEKELAEHEMLVELSKEDLARVCEEDSIQVPTDMVIEKYQHVMHIVSEVKGRLREDLSSIDALISCLPAGTVSGAPRLRAMQIINELEDKMRGPYGGGIGYINYNGDLNMALTIRSLFVKGETAYLQAGAGIVSESDPSKEYEETLHKARSLLEAAYVSQ